MNDTSYTLLRKKVSIHAITLAIILMIGLSYYFIVAAMGIQGDHYAAFIFPVFIWGKIAVINGPTYAVFSSIALLLVFPVLLFIWGRGYREKQHFGLRLQICYGLFLSLLGYCWLRSAVIHGMLLFPPKADTPYPPGYFPAPQSTLIETLSRNLNEPVRGWIFMVYIITLAVYTLEVLWTLRLLKRAGKIARADDANATGPSLS